MILVILKLLVVLFFLIMFIRRPRVAWGIGLLTVTTAVLLDTLLGTFNRRLASRGSRRALKGSRSESAALRLDRVRLTQQLDDERTEHSRVDSPTTPPNGPLT